MDRNLKTDYKPAEPSSIRHIVVGWTNNGTNGQPTQISLPDTREKNETK
jgi:hypothetical protein